MSRMSSQIQLKASWTDDGSPSKSEMYAVIKSLSEHRSRLCLIIRDEARTQKTEGEKILLPVYMSSYQSCASRDGV